MAERAARVHDVGDVAVLLVGLRRDQRSGRAAEDDGRVVEVEQQRADRVGAHRPRRRGSARASPRPVSIGGPQLPTWTASHGSVSTASGLTLGPAVDVVGAGDGVGRAVVAGQGEVAAADPAGEQGQPLVRRRPGRAAGETENEAKSVGRQQLLRDRPTRRTRCTWRSRWSLASSSTKRTNRASSMPFDSARRRRVEHPLAERGRRGRSARRRCRAAISRRCVDASR